MAAPDYQTLIDPPTWAYIRKSESFYPPDAIGLTIAGQRAVYDRMAQAFDCPHPPGIVTRDAVVAGVPVRWYDGAGARATVVYMHGGGFVVGGLASHDAICAEIAAATRCRVVAVDYRLSPEHLHPAAFDDCRAVTRAVAAGAAGPLVLAGDSAGGNLAAAVTQATRGEGLGIAGLVLIYPGLGGDTGRGSALIHAHAPQLTRDDLLFYAGIRFAGGIAPAPEPTANPLADTDFTGLPPVTLFAAACDPLADDCHDYARRVTAGGGQARVITEAGLVHGYLRARHSVPRAAASFARITDAIAAHATVKEPTP